MFKITNGRLKTAEIARLAGFQLPIDQEVLYPYKVVVAASQWDLKRSDWLDFGHSQAT